MTNSPDGKEIRYKTAKELEELFVQLGFGKILEGCKKRPIVSGTFSPSKVTHPGTVQEDGVVFTDTSGIRAVIFHYRHSDGTSVRSIKRLVAHDADYRLLFPHA